MPKTQTDWRIRIASHVRKLVRVDRILARFRDMCGLFQEEKRQDEQRLLDWRRKRRGYVFRDIRTLDELKSRRVATEHLDRRDAASIEKTRPKSDKKKHLVHEWYHDVLEQTDAKKLDPKIHGSMVVELSVWVPEEFLKSAQPKRTVPCLFDRFDNETFPFIPRGVDTPGIASIAEKYATLAAFHDAEFSDRNPIDPIDSLDTDCLLDLMRLEQRKLRVASIKSLPPKSELIIREWLRDVEVDIGNALGANSLLRINQHGPPKWLRRIAECVHEDTRDPRKKQRYVQMTRAWAERTAKEGRWKGKRLQEHLREEHPDWNDERIESEIENSIKIYGGVPVHFSDDPIAITTHQSTPLDKKYATLAAIHDVIHNCDFPLSPWKGVDLKCPIGKESNDENAKNAHAEKLMAQILYGKLCDEVDNVCDGDEAGIGRMLDDVAGDIASQFDGTTRKEPTKGMERRRKSKRRMAKSLTKKQAVVVQLVEESQMSFSDIAKAQTKSIQAVQQLYERAKANPGYKKRRSFNLRAAEPMHANTESKSSRRGNG